MADHVGVYEIAGAVMPAPTVRTSINIEQVFEQAASASYAELVDEEPTERHLHMSSYTFVLPPGHTSTLTSSSGWGYDDVIGELSETMHEVTRLNAYLSGTESIDSFVDQQLFYSKSDRLQYSLYSRRMAMADLLANPPETAPSSSFDNRARRPDGNWTATSKAQVGVATGIVHPSGVLEVGSWQTYLSQTVDAYGTPILPFIPTQLVTASLCNVIFIGNDWAIVTGTATSGVLGHPTFTFYIAAKGSGTYLTSSGMSWPPASGTAISLLSWVPLSSSLKGVYVNNTVYDPFYVNVPVTASGKIKDIRVWVELIHDTRLATGTDQGLQGLAIALRSPNTAFYSCHPLWNNPQVASFSINGDPSVTGTWAKPPVLYQNSYLLWAGRGVDDGVRLALQDTRYSASYHTFDTDLDMRTIFWDGSSVKNPRDLTALYPNASDTSPGAPLPYGNIVGTVNYQSPTYGLVTKRVLPTASLTAALGTGSLTCSSVPWFLEDRSGTVPGALSGTTYSNTPAPTVWADSYGAQIGAINIQPVYSLLDDVYVSKATVDPLSIASFRLSPTTQIIGFRPGLRNTELSGTWQVGIGTAADHMYANGYTANALAGVWVRRVKIEAIADVSASTETFTPSTARRYLRSTNVRQEGYNRVAIMSGASSWDVGLNYVTFFQSPEYGRTVSITDQTASVDTYAVLSFITGILYAQLSASGIVSPSWFLRGNSFGTPYIPDSSMSLGTGTAEAIDAAASVEIYNQTLGIQKQIPAANDADAYLNRQGYTKTTAQRWEDTITAQATSSSGYFPA